MSVATPVELHRLPTALLRAELRARLSACPPGGAPRIAHYAGIGAAAARIAHAGRDDARGGARAHRGSRRRPHRAADAARHRPQAPRGADFLPRRTHGGGRRRRHRGGAARGGRGDRARPGVRGGARLPAGPRSHHRLPGDARRRHRAPGILAGARPDGGRRHFRSSPASPARPVDPDAATAQLRRGGDRVPRPALGPVQHLGSDGRHAVHAARRPRRTASHGH